MLVCDAKKIDMLVQIYIYVYKINMLYWYFSLLILKHNTIVV